MDESKINVSGSSPIIVEKFGKLKETRRKAGQKWRDNKYALGLKPITLFVRKDLHEQIKEYVLILNKNIEE